MGAKKNKKWIRFRHTVVTNLAFLVIYPYSLLKYGIKIEKFADSKRQYLVLLNHQTPFDQFFVGMSFNRKTMYYLATEDIFSKGFLSKLIRFLIAPIPIKKQTTDIKAVMTCLRVAREGGSIVIAPEGNRTYSGRTEYMNPAIVSLAKKLSLPIALYRLEGGYGVQPRWSDVTRKGKMRGYVYEVIEPEEYKSLTDDELFERIKEGLYVDETTLGGEFFHKNRANYLERCIYVCPFCGLSEFHSEGGFVKCVKCGREAEYTVTKEFKGVGYEHPFRFVADWYDYQEQYINSLNTLSLTESPLYTESIRLYEIIPYKNRYLVKKEASVSLYGDRVTVDDLTFDFDSVSQLSVLGKNKLNIYYGDKLYQFKGSKRFNALKYLHFYYRYKNIKGENDDQFLGL
ncbi:MAG: 1-acyl-sn-glycerol-3-phosphate acyltransferase [Clostridia bacterium]|nr:1-acyl-sn-glycerol-3-phosphate acyltransferase [Clostridia bacterium]